MKSHGPQTFACARLDAGADYVNKALKEVLGCDEGKI